MEAYVTFHHLHAIFFFFLVFQFNYPERKAKRFIINSNISSYTYSIIIIIIIIDSSIKYNSKHWLNHALEWEWPWFMKKQVEFWACPKNKKKKFHEAGIHKAVWCLHVLTKISDKNGIVLFSWFMKPGSPRGSF